MNKVNEWKPEVQSNSLTPDCRGKHEWRLIDVKPDKFRCVRCGKLKSNEKENNNEK